MLKSSTKYTFVCDPDECDTMIEVTCPSGFDFPNGVIQLTCPCGRQMSYISATITPLNERNEMEDTRFAEAPAEYNANNLVTYKKIENGEISFPTLKVNQLETELHEKRRLTDKVNSLQSQINRIIDNMTEDYWYNPNTEASTILDDLCEILDYQPKKEIHFEGTIHFSGRIDVALADAEDFDLDEVMSDITVDIYNGDVIIDDYSVEDVRESY